MNSQYMKYINKLVSIALFVIIAIVGRYGYTQYEDYMQYKHMLTERDIPIINHYVETHPNHKHIQELYNHLNQLDDEYFLENLSLPIENIPAKNLTFYTQNFPNGKHLNEVNVLTAKRSDYDDYSAAVDVYSKDAFNKYLASHPRGAYRQQAQQQIKAIEKDNKLRNNSLYNGALPWVATYGRNCKSSYDYCEIEINAPSDRDVIVTARSKRNGQVLGHIYVRQNRKASFNIPEGNYEVAFRYGTGWDAQKILQGKHDRLIGDFYDHISTQHEERYFQSGHIMSYTLTTQINGNLRLDEANENDVF